MPRPFRWALPGLLPFVVGAPAAAEPVLEPLVVTASRSGDAIPADEIGASVTVIDDDDLRVRQTLVVSDVLRDVPGLAVSRTGAVGAFTDVRIRGAEANHTLVLVDGIKASDPFFDSFDFGTLIVDPAARVEVLRGQQSALYGSDAIGGVVSYTTLTGAEAPGVRLRVEGGAMGTLSGGARAAGVSGPLDYAVSVSGLHTAGYPVAVGGRRDVGSDGAAAAARLIWSPSADLRLTAVARYGHTRADTNDSDPDPASPTFGLTIDSPGAHFVNDAFYGLVRAELRALDGRWTSGLSLQLADTRRSEFDTPDPFAPRAGQPIAKVGGDHGRRYRESFESTLRFGDGAVRQRVTLALDGEQNASRTTVSPFGAFLGQEHITNLGLTGAYDLTVSDRAVLGVALRRDWNSRFADDVTYRVQASYRIAEGLRVHAAAGSGVKDPGFADLFDFTEGRFIGNPNLRPERSHGWEAGIEKTWGGGAARVDVTAFDNRLTDTITLTFVGGFATPVNLPGSDPQRGVEVSVAARPSPDWRLDASYTFLDAPQHRTVLIDGAPVDFHGQAVRRPRHLASATLSWAPAARAYSAAVTVRYNGRQNDLAFTDPSFTPVLVSLKPFVLLNLEGAWRIGRSAELFGRVENLLDPSYQEVFSFAGAGRAAYAGVRLAF